MEIMNRKYLYDQIMKKWMPEYGTGLLNRDASLPSIVGIPTISKFLQKFPTISYFFEIPPKVSYISMGVNIFPE